MKKHLLLIAVLLLFSFNVNSQNYFYENYAPFDAKIPTPKEFLGYSIGAQHTRHDQVVAYFEKLASLSDKAVLTEYGRTHENRKLLILRITTPQNNIDIEQLKTKHLNLVDPNKQVTDYSNLPLFINLGYNVHGNEPSGTEAALLTAYTLIASKNKLIEHYLNNAIIFIDPTINPDGRDRHTQWVNSRKSENLVADPLDFEHTESWPSGRTNHYWFDLNRDWLLAVHPESQGKLKWFHEWYPNIVTDFHEMGTNINTYFFEPEKISGSVIPLTPKENYSTLNNIFAREFAKELEKIGSFYFTNELFDATYPGYGSTYADLQGSLALLFEQTSSRGHLKETQTGTITFPFTIRNQYISTFTTIRTAVKNKDILYKYQQNFFKNRLNEAKKSPIKAYVFGDNDDKNRTNEFIKLLLHHNIKVFKANKDIKQNGISFNKDNAYVIPTEQNQNKLLKTMFTTFDKYRDSVFYDASAWSVAHFYNMPFSGSRKKIAVSQEINLDNLYTKPKNIAKADYAYIISWTDYNTPALLYFLQKSGITAKITSKELAVKSNQKVTNFGRGSLVIPVPLQKLSKESVYKIINKAAKKWHIAVTAINSGENDTGISLGGRSLLTLQKPKALLWVGNGVSQYEAGEVWHLLDTKINMPLTKVALRNFNRVNFNKYNVMIMVSGSYHQLDSTKRKKIQNWIAQGNTLITSRGASAWAIRKKIVNEELLSQKKDSLNKPRLDYGDFYENYGKERVGGAIFNVDLDITHPIGYGYTRRSLPVYRNSSVWLKPSKSPYSTVAKYADNPHIDGFISTKNYKTLMQSASIITSKVGRGRVVMFADNPNFRGAWYGTNKLFLNAIFFGSHIKVPK